MSKSKRIGRLLLSAFPVGDPPQEPTKGGIFLDESECARSIFFGKRWTDLDLRNYKEWETQVLLGYLTPEAFKYYFPGLLFAFFDEDTRNNNAHLVYDFLGSILTIQLPISLDDPDYQIKNFLTNLSNSQKYPIALWIKKMEEDANDVLTPRGWDALKAYWTPYLTPPK